MNNSTTTIGHQEQCDVNLFKGKGTLCSMFSEPNDDSLICNICHCDDTVLWNKCHYAKGYKEYNNIPPKEWVNILFGNMETKEIKINVPDGYEIDKENSTFEKIVFKPIVKRWRDDEMNILKGYYIDSLSHIKPAMSSRCYHNISENSNIFFTEKQARSALAMAQISQIMANDERFGGIITDKEWKDHNLLKFVLIRNNEKIREDNAYCNYSFLAFHTHKQCELFFEENKDLIKDYLMLD